MFVSEATIFSLTMQEKRQNFCIDPVIQYLFRPRLASFRSATLISIMYLVDVVLDFAIARDHQRQLSLSLSYTFASLYFQS